MRNNCFIECKDIILPFTVEDFLIEEDIKLVNATDFPEDPRIQYPNSKIMWTNWQIGTNRMSEHANQTNQERFNGMGLIINTELKHKVNEWIQDTFNPDFVDTNWKDAFGRITPPVTILCFNKTSGWHKEGPLQIPDNFQHLTDPIKLRRWPAVLNYRLTGDVEDSILQFAKLSSDLEQKVEQLTLNFFDYCDSKGKTWDEKTQDWQRIGPTDAITKDELRIMTHTDYILNDELYKDHISIEQQYVGMHNPYVVNLSKFHRVITNGTPRVTLRVHSNKDLSFEQIEEMYETGKLFK